MSLYRVWDAHLAHVEKASLIYRWCWQPVHCNTSCGNTHIIGDFQQRTLHIYWWPRWRTPHVYWWPPMSDTTLQHDGVSWRNKGILRKVRHNITLHRPITSRSKNNPRHLSGQSAAQDGLTRLQPHWTCLRLSGQQVAQGRLTRLQPYWISAQLQTPSCPGWTHLPAAPPAHLRHPGTQTPVAGCQCHIAPDHLAHCRMGSAQHRQSTRPAPQCSSTPIISSLPSSSPNPSSPWGVMWEHPHILVTPDEEHSTYIGDPWWRAPHIYWWPRHRMPHNPLTSENVVVTFWNCVAMWQNLPLSGIEIICYHIIHILFKWWLMYSFIHTVRNLNAYVCVMKINCYWRFFYLACN